VDKERKMACPCGSGLTYAVCCKGYHQGKAAPTAEALMRSRYSAYVRRDGAYLHRTWAQETRPSKASLAKLADTHWCGLTIIETTEGLVEDAQGCVHFIARFIAPDDSEQQMEEVSLFRRDKGRWVYVSGDVTSTDTIHHS